MFPILCIFSLLLFYLIQDLNLASLIAQLVKSLPAIQETLVRFLGQEDPLEKGKATHSSILAWRIHSMNHMVHGSAKSRTRLSHFRFHFNLRSYT